MKPYTSGSASTKCRVEMSTKNCESCPRLAGNTGIQRIHEVFCPESAIFQNDPPPWRPVSSWGNWEGDTVIGRDRHHCILTLVERASGLAIIKKLESRTAAEVNRAAADAIREYEGNFKTLTLDNGTEFHGYKDLEEEFSLKCYFATPYHSWERGSNENLNGLIRQYLPKGVCMQEVTQTYCDAMGHRLNSRPRKRYGYRTPQAVYDAKSRNCTSRLNPGID